MRRILGTGLVLDSIARHLGEEGHLLEMVCTETRARFNSRLRLELHILGKINTVRDDAEVFEFHTFQWVRVAPMRWVYKHFPGWEVREDDDDDDDEYYRGRMVSCWCDY